jgi:hypothetical protein
VIRINLQTQKNLERNQLVTKAFNVLRARSFSGRHPEVGRMINCPVCDRRHRGNICEPKYGVGRWDPEKKSLIACQDTQKGVLGAVGFAKKRKHSHPSKRKLQLVQRTQEIFHEYWPYFTNAKECMEMSREEAVRQLKKERAKTSKFFRSVKDVSRRINAGLARTGSRYLAPVPVNLTDAGRQKRFDRQIKLRDERKE